MCTGMLIETIYRYKHMVFHSFSNSQVTFRVGGSEPHFSTAAINVLILMPAAPVLCCVRRYLRQDPI